MSAIVNNSPPKTKLLVNGNNYSNLLTKLNISIGQINPSGLCLTNGSFTLNKSVLSDFVGSMDDLINPDFARGNECILDFDSYDSPVGAYTYIISTEYDEVNETVLNVGCKLSLLNARSPEDIASCVGYSSNISGYTLVNNLLIKAGITTGLSGIRGSTRNSWVTIYETITLQKTQSFLRLAGQIAYANGYVLYQYKDGKIYAYDWLSSSLQSIDEPTLLTDVGYLSKDTIETYRRLSEPESLSKKYIVNYSKKLEDVVCKNNLGNSSSLGGSVTTVVEDTTLDGVGNTVTIKETYNDSVKYYTSLATDVIGGVVLQTTPEMKTTVETYEPFDLSTNTYTDSSEECFKQQDGRLLSVTTEYTKDSTYSLEAYESWRQFTAIQNQFLGLIVGNESNYEVPKGTNYVHSKDSVVYDYSPNEDVITIISSKYKVAAVLYPRIGNPFLGGLPEATTSPVYIDPLALMEYERVVETYTKNDCGSWNLTTAKYVSNALKNPSVYGILSLYRDEVAPSKQINDASFAFQTISGLISETTEVKTNISAPSIRRRSPIQPVQYETKRAVANVSSVLISDLLNTRVSYFDGGIFTKDTTASSLANAISSLNVGRQSGLSLVIPLRPNVPLFDDCFVNFSTVLSDTIKKYHSDGMTIEVTSQRGSIAMNGIFYKGLDTTTLEQVITPITYNPNYEADWIWSTTNLSGFNGSTDVNVTTTWNWKGGTPVIMEAPSQPLGFTDVRIWSLTEDNTNEIYA